MLSCGFGLTNWYLVIKIYLRKQLRIFSQILLKFYEL
jgi:hypothetical protein